MIKYSVIGLGILLASLGFSAAPAQSIAISFVEVTNDAVVAATNRANEYTITLNHLDPYVTYYGERPSRASGLATLENFAAAWSVGPNSFTENPPNAVLYAGMINGNTNQSNSFFIFHLSKPVVNMQNREVSYTGTWIGGTRIVLKEMHLNAVSLVIN